MAFLRNLLKITSVSAAFALVAGASLAYADVDVDGSNDTTGPSSYNKTEIETNRDWTVRVENDVDIDRDVDTDVDTGGNEVECNTLVGDQTGGDVNVDIIGSSEDFDADSDIFGLPAITMNDISFTGGNSLTGPHSYNKNEVEANQKVHIDLENDINIDNDVDFDAQTGDNEVSHNTSVGDINSGDVSVSANLSSGTHLSSGLSSFDTASLTENDISADFTNELTGPNSENINELEANSWICLDFENNVDINNDLDFDVNTGDNEIEGNTSVGDIETGSIDISAVMD